MIARIGEKIGTAIPECLLCDAPINNIYAVSADNNTASAEIVCVLCPACFKRIEKYVKTKKENSVRTFLLEAGFLTLTGGRSNV